MNTWQSVAYSSLGIAVPPLANTYETHLITHHCSALQLRPLVNVAEVTPAKFSTPAVRLKLRGRWFESHQISIRCTEMIANYYSEIKIATI